MIKQSYMKKRLSEFFIIYGIVTLMFSSFSLVSLVFSLIGISYLVRVEVENNQLLEHLIKKTKVQKDLLLTLFQDESNKECYYLNKRAVESLIQGEVTEENRANLITLLEGNKVLLPQADNYTECKSLILEKIISEFSESEVSQAQGNTVVDYDEVTEELDNLFEDSFLYINAKDLTEGGDE